MDDNPGQDLGIISRVANHWDQILYTTLEPSAILLLLTD